MLEPKKSVCVKRERERGREREFVLEPKKCVCVKRERGREREFVLEPKRVCVCV